jgi:hypothetical protein
VDKNDLVAFGTNIDQPRIGIHASGNAQGLLRSFSFLGNFTGRYRNRGGTGSR